MRVQRQRRLLLLPVRLLLPLLLPQQEQEQEQPGARHRTHLVPVCPCAALACLQLSRPTWREGPQAAGQRPVTHRLSKAASIEAFPLL